MGQTPLPRPRAARLRVVSSKKSADFSLLYSVRLAALVAPQAKFSFSPASIFYSDIFSSDKKKVRQEKFDKN
jgi:hypothetical protein